MFRNWTYLLCFVALLWGGASLSAQESDACLSFALEDVSANPGEEFCIDLKAYHFENILGFQWSMRYDADMLEFREVKDFNLSGLSTSSFATPSVGPASSITVAWSDPTTTGVDLASGTSLARLCFEPLVEAGKTMVEFLNSPTPVELIDGHLTISSASFRAAEVQIGNTPASQLSIENICIYPSVCEDLGGGVVQAHVASTQGPLTYAWTGPGGFTSHTSSFAAPGPGFYQLEVSNSLGEVARGSAFVSAAVQGQVASAEITPVPCDGNGGGAISLSLGESNSAYHFAWSTGDTGPTIDGLSAGTYTVTISSNTTNCSAVEMYQVPQEEIRGSLLTTCISEGEVELRASLFDATGGPHTFEWSTGETHTGANENKIVVAVSTTSSYSVTVTNTLGCSTVLLGTVPSCEPPPQEESTYEGCLLFEVGETQAEKGDIACVDIRVQDFDHILGSQFTVQWDPAQLGFNETQNFSLGISTFSFGITAESLENGQLVFAWTDPHVISRSLADHEVIFTLCFEVLAETGFAPIQINETRVAMEALWAIDPADSFQEIPFSVIDGGIHIGQLIGSAPQVDQICTAIFGCGTDSYTQIEAVVSIGTAPYMYNWKGPLGFEATEEAVQVTNAGFYTLTVTDQNGAVATGAVRVIDNSQLAISGNITSVSCTGIDDGSIEITNISNPGSYSYSWSNGATTKDIDNLTVGEYTVTVTDSETACEAVKRFQVEKGGIDAGLHYNCIDSLNTSVTAMIFAGEPSDYTFSWSNGTVDTAASQSTVQVAVGDSISVIVSDTLGCSYTSQVLRPACSNVTPTAEIYATYAYDCAADNERAELTALVWNTDTGPYSFTWSTGAVASGVQNSTITVPTGGTYHVTITDGLGNTKVLGNINPDCEGENGQPLELSIGEINANTGESACLAVRAKNFTNILGLQYAVAWDPNALELNSIQHHSLPNLDGNNFNLGGNNYQNGLLRFAWVDPNAIGVTMPTDAILYEMCFTVRGQEGKIPVFFDEASMQTEFVNEQSESVFPVLDDGLVIINGQERMWPGDTDHNEVANHFDVLNLGLAYGAMGPLRSDANLIWRGQWATDWGQTTPATGVDYKHIDTNGDGVINTADTTAISINWGRAVNLSPDPLAEYRTSPLEIEMQGAPIYIEAYSVRPGETVTFNINLGDSDTPVQGAYGLAFTVVYDPLAVVYGSAKASFQDSWLGQLGADMIALVKDDPSNHRLHIGMTRIDQLNVDGSGTIGQISMTIEDVIFRDTEYEMPFRVENVRLIRTTEEEIEVNQKQTIGTVTDTPLATEQLPAAQRVKLFPNPTTDKVNIIYESIHLDRIQILSLSGQLLREYKAMDQISLRGLPRSTYFLRFIGPDGVLLKKVIKQRQ